MLPSPRIVDKIVQPVERLDRLRHHGFRFAGMADIAGSRHDECAARASRSTASIPRLSSGRKFKATRAPA
jgi:hypothetical protein